MSKSTKKLEKIFFSFDCFFSFQLFRMSQNTLNFNDNATTIIIEKYNSKSNSKTLFMNIMNNV